MSKLASPIFQNKLPKISWKKIYSREYGVQYSEMAILCLSPKAKPHIPKPSVTQVVIPEGNNTAFYIDAVSWIELVESLNSAYTSHLKKLEAYEKQFIADGNKYLETAKKIAKINLWELTNYDLKNLYLDYQEKLFHYSLFTWSAFILNNYVAERAMLILDPYIKRHRRDADKQDIYDALFSPDKLAAVLRLQEEVFKYHGKLDAKHFDNLYERYKWLSCLDIHNRPWTKKEFDRHIKTFAKTEGKKKLNFSKIADELKIKNDDLEYLLMAKRFVYIKDARDDYRRRGVYFAVPLFKEIARRMHLNTDDVSYLQAKEILKFLEGKIKISPAIPRERKRGFILYLNVKQELICLQGKNIPTALHLLKLTMEKKELKELKGMVASKGTVDGIVTIVRGIKDLKKVKQGNILVAVTTHPDYVPAMRLAAAIVTDEGGITSHAAIVSREFGIPCIVGTKHSTSLLKDGDRIHVDAVNGIVKKL